MVSHFMTDFEMVLPLPEVLPALFKFSVDEAPIGKAKGAFMRDGCLFRNFQK